MAKSVHRGPRELWHALIWSLQGLRAAWQTESAFRLEVVLLVIFVPLGLWLGVGGSEKALLVGVLLPIPAGEMFNSAVEALADKLWPEQNPVAGRIKDLAAAAVFVLIVNALVVWTLVWAL
ncbi:MAG: diacylglycerol kinase [Rhodanobacter sp.]